MLKLILILVCFFTVEFSLCQWVPSTTTAKKNNVKEKNNCEPKWYNQRGEYEGLIYGTGFAESFHRTLAGDKAEDNARKNAIKQIRMYVSAHLEEIIDEVVETIYKEGLFKTNTAEYRNNVEKVHTELRSKIDEIECNRCFITDFDDCQNDKKRAGLWKAYARIKIDINNWKNKLYKPEVEKLLNEVEIKLKRELNKK